MKGKNHRLPKIHELSFAANKLEHVQNLDCSYVYDIQKENKHKRKPD